MFRKMIGLLAAVAVLGGPATASAQSVETRADIRCLVVSLLMVNSPKPELRQAGMMSAIYYFGRLDGSARSPNLEDMIVKEIEKIKPDQLRDEAIRCGGELKARGDAMSELGANISARAKMPELPISD